MPFINLTPHDINEVTTGLTIPSKGVARVRSATRIVGIVDNINIYQSVFDGTIENLPDPVPGTIYIVSALALNAVPAYRTDVVAPGNLIRNEQGQAIGCQGFRRA